MASIECISSCLEQVSAAYNRPGSWMAKCTSLWEREFATRTDGQLDRALRMWVRAEPKAPTIAELHALMDGEGRNGTLGQVKPEGCLDCEGSGWRAAAWHRLEHGRLRVGTFALPCTCPRGEGMGQRSVPRMDTTLQAWRDHPATVAVYLTDEDNPTLTKEERGVNAPVKPG